jgi:hypothetical protein
MKSYCRKGAYTPGIKTADQPVLLDVPDSLDVEEGVGGVGLVTGTTGACLVVSRCCGQAGGKLGGGASFMLLGRNIRR